MRFENKKRAWLYSALSVGGVLGSAIATQASISVSSTEEAMVLSGNPTEVWDPKGATEISGNGLNSASPGNKEYALVYFNTAAAVANLNTQFGVGGWTLTGVSLQLPSNFPTANVFPNNNVFNEIEPGAFNISWMSNNGWISSSSGGVTWNTLPNYLPGAGNNLQEAEGSFNYAANGSSPLVWTLTPSADFINSIDSGGGVSLYGTPGDNNVGYLFNAPTQGNPAVLVLTAQAAVPEPASFTLIALASATMLPRMLSRRRRRA